MAQVKVWNDNDYEYKETFKDREIKIPAHGCIEMEYFEAHEFKGTYKAIQRDGDNQPLPQSYKKIRVEEPPKESLDPKIESNTCAACKYRGSSPKDLLEHIVENHAHQHVVDEELEREIAVKAKKKAG